MFFMNRFCIQGLNIGKDLRPDFLFKNGSDNVKVFLCDHVETDWNIQPKGNALCTVILERALSKEIAAMFDCFIKDRLPPEFTEIPSKPGEFQPSDTFALFSREVEEDLASYATRIANLISWRCKFRGSFRCFPKHDLRWSLDSRKWTAMLACTKLTSDPWGLWPFGERHLKLVQASAARGNKPPVGYELFRRAYVREAGERASLVMAVAAAEVRVKECIIDLAPDTEWLALNVPSPPLGKILRKYLPDLRKKCMNPNKVDKIPGRIVKSLEGAVEIRNRISHKGEPGPNPSKMIEILTAVHDFLYILDYYCGYEWALENLSKNTKEELGLK